MFCDAFGDKARLELYLSLRLGQYCRLYYNYSTAQHQRAEANVLPKLCSWTSLKHFIPSPENVKEKCYKSTAMSAESATPDNPFLQCDTHLGWVLHSSWKAGLWDRGWVGEWLPWLFGSKIRYPNLRRKLVSSDWESEVGSRRLGGFWRNHSWHTSIWKCLGKRHSRISTTEYYNTMVFSSTFAALIEELQKPATCKSC